MNHSEVQINYSLLTFLIKIHFETYTFKIVYKLNKISGFSKIF